MRDSRPFLTSCTLSGLFLLQAAIAHAQFDASDLEGTWHVYTRWDSPAGHDAGYDNLIGFQVGATGAIPNFGGNLSSSEPFFTDFVTGGSLSIDPNGRFGGTVEFSAGPNASIDQFQLGVGSNTAPLATPPSDLFLGVVTDSDGFVNLSVGIRQMQSGFSVGDITGASWRFFSLWDQPDFGGNDPGWDRGSFSFRPTTGNRAVIENTTGINSNGQPMNLDGVEVAVQVDGRVALLPIPGEFRLSRDKNWMAGVTIDPDDYRALAVLMRAAISTSQQDLEGTWSWYRFSDDSTGNAPRWARGVFVVDAAGNIATGNTQRSDGVTDRVVGGSLLVDPVTREINGSIVYASLPVDPFVEARLSLGGNLLAGVASEGTRHGLTVAVPVAEPSAGMGLAFALLVVFALRARQPAASCKK
jgi:hypothetical protein